MLFLRRRRYFLTLLRIKYYIYRDDNAKFCLQATFFRAKKPFIMISKQKYLLLIVFRGLGLFLNVVSVLITARYFGTSQDRDFFVIAMSVVTVLPMFLYGSLNEIYRTKFVHIMETLGTEKAVDSARSVVFWISAMSMAIILLGECYAEAIAGFFLGDSKSSSFPMLVTLIRITLPIIFLSQLSSFWIQTLNCFNIYFIPEISGLFSSVINISVVVLLFDTLGVFSLVISSYAGAGLLTVILVFIVRKNIPGMISLRIVRFGDIRPYIVTALPFILGYWIGQISIIVEKKLSAGMGVGNVALLDYAQKLLSIPQGVIFSVVTAILSPTLAKHYANWESAHFANELWSFYRFIVIILAPCVFCMFFLPREIGSILFATKISPSEISVFGIVAMIYGFGMLGVINQIIFSQALIAQSKVPLVSVIALVNQIMILICNLTFAYKWGIAGLAISWSAGHILCGIALMYASRALERGSVILILRLCALYLLSFLTVGIINHFLTVLADVPRIAVNLVILCGIMYIIMRVLRFEEARKLGQYLSCFNSWIGSEKTKKLPEKNR